MFFETTYDPDNKSLLCQLVEYTSKYHPYVIESAEKYNLNPWVIAGLGSRESHWGLALKPKGPGGTGDHAPRKGKMPPDGLGWGRGIMQIDYFSHPFARGDEWMDPQKNIMYGSKVLANSMRTIKGRCTLKDGSIVIPGYDSDRLICYGLAAYNAGPLAVLTAIRRGVDVDLVTTGDNYSADVLSRAGWFQRALLVES